MFQGCLWVWLFWFGDFGNCAVISMFYCNIDFVFLVFLIYYFMYVRVYFGELCWLVVLVLGGMIRLGCFDFVCGFEWGVYVLVIMSDIYIGGLYPELTVFSVVRW